MAGNMAVGNLGRVTQLFWRFLQVASRIFKTAYSIARKAAQDPSWRLSAAFMKQLHAAITDGISHKYNRPGLIRSNPKNIITHAGDAAWFASAFYSPGVANLLISDFERFTEKGGDLRILQISPIFRNLCRV
jgi:hypothetical protein